MAIAIADDELELPRCGWCKRQRFTKPVDLGGPEAELLCRACELESQLFDDPPPSRRANVLKRYPGLARRLEWAKPAQSQ